MKAYIITGAPGTGKTSIIEELIQKGYSGLEEVARKLLLEKKAEQRGIKPFKDIEKFAHLVFEETYKQYIEAAKRSLTKSNIPQHSAQAYIRNNAKSYSNYQQKEADSFFFDRSLPDVFVYLENSTFPIPNEYYEKLSNCNFEKNVFICPPWKEIYTIDSIRPYPYKDTLKLHSQVIATYEKLGFHLIEIPKYPVPQRTEFILKAIGNTPGSR